jgi:hypothetical protein
MESYLEWWNSLSGWLRVLWLLAGPFSLLFLSQALAFFLTPPPDADDSADDDHPENHSITRLISVKSLPGFFAAFGWTGIACTEAGLPWGAAAVVSGVVASAAAVALGRLFSGAPSRESSLKLSDISTGAGKVLFPIQARRGNIGKVRIKTTAVFRTLNAVTDDASDIESNQVVTIVKVLANNTLLVTRK